MQHDLLQNSAHTCCCIAAEIVNGTSVQCGYFFADNIKDVGVQVSSGTGYTYNISLSEEYRNVPSGSQFNVTLPIKAVVVN